MPGARRFLLGLSTAILLGACGGQKTVDRSDAVAADADTSASDAGASGDSVDIGDADACFALFHGCATTTDCCAPYRCLDTTGGLTCQIDSPTDAATGLDTGVSDASSGGVDGLACFPLFHPCVASSDCCSPYLCLTITGQPACQLEGPALDGF